jgi:hypothetical protein
LKKDEISSVRFSKKNNYQNLTQNCAQGPYALDPGQHIAWGCWGGEVADIVQAVVRMKREGVTLSDVGLALGAASRLATSIWGEGDADKPPSSGGACSAEAEDGGRRKKGLKVESGCNSCDICKAIARAAH